MKVANATTEPQETAMHLFFENEDVGENYAYTTSEWDLHNMALTILCLVYYETVLEPQKI